MTTPPREPDVFYIAPAYSDSAGRSVIPKNAILVGPHNIVMERVLDSKARKTALSLINDADRVRKAQTALRADAAALAAERAAFATEADAVREVLLKEFVGKLDALSQRIAAIEASRAHDPDDDELPSPPGIASGEAGGSASHGDDGHLQTPLPPPKANEGGRP